MQVTVDIPDNLAERIVATGTPVEVYVRESIRSALSELEHTSTGVAGRITVDEFLRRASSYAVAAPLPLSALTREAIYDDHD